MKRIFCLFLTILLLTGCTASVPENRQEISVCLEEGYGFTADESLCSVLPGADVQFHLRTQRGMTVTGADYRGEYQLSREKGVTTLTLKNVVFPARIHLTLSSRYCTVNYEPNGGLGDVFSVNYSLNSHSRPNTAIGTDCFFRGGYTLTGWNTAPDGSGISVGLGSRVSVPQHTLTLYAQWAPWSDRAFFNCSDGIITAYNGNEKTIVIPEFLDGQPVTGLASGSFAGCSAETVIFPKSIKAVEAGAFQGSSLSEVTLFDNIVAIPDDAFQDCPNLQALHINAIEAPYGYASAKESCYADKIDLLINAQGQRKLVCYGGCSMWYNLEGSQFQQAFGQQYRIINVALNGTVSSAVQMQILTRFMEDGDVFFHTPEIASRHQLMLDTDMGRNDSRLWCGLENNYDLFALVDLREIGGAFGSLSYYLSTKKQQTSYDQVFTDDNQVFMDGWGCVPIARASTQKSLADRVFLNPDFLNEDAMHALEHYYNRLEEKGVSIYLSYACVNLDAVPIAEQDNVSLMDELFHARIAEMSGPVLVSTLSDYLYHKTDCFDTNYHLLFPQVQENTRRWVQDLTAQFRAEGVWEDAA